MPGGDAFANYEATVTTGLESIAQDEVKEKLQVEATCQKGRIWFTTSQPVEKVLKLKSICNLFIIIYKEDLPKQQVPQDKQSLESLLFQVGDKCDWARGLAKWQEMSKFEATHDMLFTRNPDNRDKQPKFRVSSNRYGPEHKFTSPEICCLFGHVVDTKFGWPIKMKDYDLEIMVNFNENQIYAGFTLSHLSLDRRNIISVGFTTLRAATCYALLRLAKIRTGDIVIDPMAGSGAIPVECCACSIDSEWSAFTIAGELKSSPLEKCKINLNIFDQKNAPRDLMKLDVTALPFRDSSIDVYVSDLPFGRRHGTKKLNRTLYPALLKSMARTAKLAEARAVLLTQDFKSMNLAIDENRKYWNQKLCSFVKIGNLNCYIYLFHRNSKHFEETVEAT